MKSPKEEAEELVDKFIQVDFCKDNEGMYRPLAVHCAIICVDRIIKEIEEEIKPYSYDNDIPTWNERIDAWKQVKSELEQMK